MIAIYILLGIIIVLHVVQLVKETHMSAELDRLTASVTAEEGQVDSLIALVNGLAQIIRDNVSNPAALTALADSMDAETGKIQAAVAANPLPTA